MTLLAGGFRRVRGRAGLTSGGEMEKFNVTDLLMAVLVSLEDRAELLPSVCVTNSFPNAGGCVFHVSKLRLCRMSVNLAFEDTSKSGVNIHSTGAA